MFTLPSLVVYTTLSTHGKDFCSIVGVLLWCRSYAFNVGNVASVEEMFTLQVYILW